MIRDEGVHPRVAVAEAEPAAATVRASCARGDLVEIVLHAGGEVVVDEALEVALEQLRHGERDERRHERRALLEDVAAVEDRAHDRRVRRGAADAAVFQRLDQGRLGVAGRRRRVVALRLEFDRVDASGRPRASAGGAPPRPRPARPCRTRTRAGSPGR